jgi:hypothetical protein
MDVLVIVQAEDAEVADRAGVATVLHRERTLGVVLDEEEPARIGERPQLTKAGRVSERG